MLIKPKTGSFIIFFLFVFNVLHVYFHIQNELIAAYTKLRNDKSQQIFHRGYASLSVEQKKKIQDMCPQRVAESYANVGQNDSVKVGKDSKQ